MKKLILLAFFTGIVFGANLKDNEFFKDANSTCPIKFIDVFKYPDWIAVLEYKNGKKAFIANIDTIWILWTENATLYF